MKKVQRSTISLLLILAELICLLSSCSAQEPFDVDISSAAEIAFPLIVSDGIIYAMDWEEWENEASPEEFVSFNIQTGEAKNHGEVGTYTVTPSGNCRELGNRVYKTFAAQNAPNSLKVYLYELSQDNMRQKFLVTDDSCSGINYIEGSDKYIYIKCLFLDEDNSHLISRIMKFDPATKKITTFLEKSATEDTRVGEQISFFAYNSVTDSLCVLLYVKDTPDGESRYYIDSYSETGTFIHRNDITELSDKVLDTAISNMIFYGNNLFIRDWSNNILLAEYDSEEDCYKSKIVSDIEFSLQPAVGKLDSSEENCDFLVFQFTGVERYRRFLVLLDASGNTLKYCSLGYLGIENNDNINFLFADGDSIYLYYEDHAPDEEYGLPRFQQKYEIKFVEIPLEELLENTFFEQTLDPANPIIREKLLPDTIPE